ncbi:lipocalin-like domain-containing protein [Elongatibacter sediminis]|uniref:Lipocalin-like domain-containing protein n=1 Tax=Elongatibacter sediminis TaxID=3119006 RepID=A0AAW9R6R7_9GAMM
MSDASLTGAWTLCSWTIRTPGVMRVSEPFGASPQGLLMYSADGWMSATVCRPERPLLPGGSPRRAPDADLADAYRSYFHYAGPYRVESGHVIHSVHYSLNPAMVGTEQVRAMQFRDDRLILTGEEPLGTGVRRHELVWRRTDTRKS